MIDFVTDREQIILLWKSVFKDSEEYINYFLDACKNKSCLGYFKNERLVSMMFLIDCSYCGCKGKYIYAVATDENHRKNGYAGALLNHAKEIMDDFLWLIPANESLIKYYKRFNFEIKLYSNSDFNDKIYFNESEDIICELYEGSEFESPRGMVYSILRFPDGDTGFVKCKGD